MFGKLSIQTRKHFSRNWGLILILIFHAILLKSTQFSAWPEMLIYPYLMKRGFSLYGDIIQPYMPLLPYTLLGLSQLVNLTVTTLSWLTLAIILGSDVLLYLVIKKHFTKTPPFLILILYVILQVSFDGNGLWFDLSCVPFLLVATHYWFKFEEGGAPKYIFWSAVFLGLAFTVKQAVIWYAILEFFLIINHYRSNINSWLIGWLIPLASVIAMFPTTKFLYWAFYYPFFVMVKMPGYVLYPTLKQTLLVLVIFIPLVGLVFLKDRQAKHIMLWGVVSLGFVFPRFDYFHFQPALPFLAIGLGIFWSKFAKKRSFVILLCAYSAIVFLIFGKRLILANTKPVRFFNDAVRSNTQKLSRILPKDQPILFYNDMGNYLVLGQFLPVKPWAANFPWYMELAGLQERIIESMENQKVAWAVTVPAQSEGAFIPGSYQAKHIEEYLEQHYTMQMQLGNELLLWVRK